MMRLKRTHAVKYCDETTQPGQTRRQTTEADRSWSISSMTVEKKKRGEAGLTRPNLTQRGRQDMPVGTDKTEAAETNKVGKDKTETVKK